MGCLLALKEVGSIVDSVLEHIKFPISTIIIPRKLVSIKFIRMNPHNHRGLLVDSSLNWRTQKTDELVLLFALGYSIQGHCTLPAAQSGDLLNTLRHQKIIVRSILHSSCFRLNTLFYQPLLVDRNLLVLNSQQHRLPREGSDYL